MPTFSVPEAVMVQPEGANLELHYQKLIAGFIGSMAAAVWYQAHWQAADQVRKPEKYGVAVIK